MNSQRQSRSHGSTLIELLVVIAIISIMVGILLPAVQAVRAAAARAHCANNLRQIGLALHQYHDAIGKLPPGTSHGPGVAYQGMSWHARLLPYAEQDSLWRQTEQAYRQEPNFAINPPHIGMTRVVSLYACPADPRSGTIQIYVDFDYQTPVVPTSYLGVSGRNALSRDGVLYGNSKVRIADIRDGTSQTLLVGERPPSATFKYGWWYAGDGQNLSGSCDSHLGVREISISVRDFCPPGPYEYVPGQPEERCDFLHFWSHHAGGAHFLFGDGSVRFLSYDVNLIMPALATRSGGEVVSVPE